MSINGTTKHIRLPKSVTKINQDAEFVYISSRSFKVHGQTMGEPRVVVKLSDAIHTRDMARDNAYIEVQRHLSRWMPNWLALRLIKGLFND